MDIKTLEFIHKLLVETDRAAKEEFAAANRAVEDAEEVNVHATYEMRKRLDNARKAKNQAYEALHVFEETDFR